MSSSESSEKTVSQSSANPAPFVPPAFVLSLATAPILVALVGSKALSVAVQELGVLSEELFRGDRLPVLHFPSATDPHPDDSTAL